MTTRTALDTALDLLSRRDHTAVELLRKLTLRGYSADVIQEALSQLEARQLLDPTRFVDNYIHYRRRKGMGPLKIKMELAERGLTEELIEDHLQITDNAWFVDAKTVWQKQFKQQWPRDLKTRAKHMRFLYQRGFTIEQINSVLNDETT